MSAGDPSDADLVGRSLAGDQAAFGTLARRYGRTLARTVRAVGVSPADAEDVTQLALVNAWRALATYDPARPFLAWVSVIAINKARDWKRQERSRNRWRADQPTAMDQALATPEPNAGPEAIEQRDHLRRVGRAVSELPDELMRPLVLVAVTGLTQREAAASMGISEKAVELRIKRARELLGRKLAQPT